MDFATLEGYEKTSLISRVGGEKIMSEFCQNCGSNKSPNDDYCLNCQDELEEYRVVREYLRAYPNSNAMQIANATGISISKILRYIRSGSLSVVEHEGQRKPR